MLKIFRNLAPIRHFEDEFPARDDVGVLQSAADK